MTPSAPSTAAPVTAGAPAPVPAGTGDAVVEHIAVDPGSRGVMATRTLPSALAVSEKEWQAQVIDLADKLGWTHLHVRRSIGKGRRWTTATNLDGWPDLTLIRPTPEHDGEIVFVELKSETGKVEPEQEAVHDLLRRAGHDVYVWRPSDLEAAGARLSAWRRKGRT